MSPAFLSLFLVFLLPLSAFATPPPEGWEALDHCRLSTSTYADGDSFHVTHHGKTQIFRLYFVDCPETDSRIPERIKDQQDAFGLNEQGVISAGHQAAAFTKKLLARPFTVLTKWEDARGASRQKRFYAIVIVDGKNLATELVRNGWARAYGMPADFPDKYRRKAFAADLRLLEARSTRAKVGAFAGSSKVLADQEEKTPADQPQVETP
jgi:endonuclease YncB( thermonuclease family)